MASFYKWRSQSFDYEYHIKSGTVMRYIAGTRKGVLASKITAGIKSCEDAKKEYYRNHEAFIRNFNK